MKALRLLLASIFLLPLPALADNADVNPAQASAWIAKTKNPVILDVRTAREYRSGHLKDARHIPWNSDDFEARVTKELQPGQPILVYCHSGSRSAAAARKLAKLGFTDVRNLEGGITSWKKGGNPVIQPR